MKTPTTQAIILAGGKGTRLSSVVPDLPKPIAPVGGRPFLQHQLQYLKKQGIREVLMSVRYRAQQIIDCVGYDFEGLKIQYCVEQEPLGTGGAIRLALEKVRAPLAFVLNGDTYFQIQLKELVHQQEKLGLDLVLAGRLMDDAGRYGGLKVAGSLLVGFEEKETVGPAIINGGIYLARKNLLTDWQGDVAFSFEREAIPKLLHNKKVGVCVSERYFIDMGIPEDYARAQKECLSW